MKVTVAIQLWWALPALLTLAMLVWMVRADGFSEDGPWPLFLSLAGVAWLLILWGRFA